jgi:hypothetical protein
MGAEQSAEALAPRPVKRGGAANGGARGAKSMPGMGDAHAPLAARPATVTGAGAWHAACALRCVALCRVSATRRAAG